MVENQRYPRVRLSFFGVILGGTLLSISAYGNILGGTPVTSSDVNSEWVGFLSNSPDEYQFCSGTLISPCAVLTARHCLHASGNFTLLNTASYSTDPSNTQFPPDNGDLAILRLTNPVPLVDGAAPSLANEVPELSDNVNVYGWSRNGGSTRLLRSGTLLFNGLSQDDHTPAGFTGNYLFSVLFSSTGQNSLCGGDSGGPTFDSAGQIVGVHSRGDMPLVTAVCYADFSFSSKPSPSSVAQQALPHCTENFVPYAINTSDGYTRDGCVDTRSLNGAGAGVARWYYLTPSPATCSSLTPKAIPSLRLKAMSQTQLVSLAQDNVAKEKLWLLHQVKGTGEPLTIYDLTLYDTTKTLLNDSPAVSLKDGSIVSSANVYNNTKNCHLSAVSEDVPVPEYQSWISSTLLSPKFNQCKNLTLTCSATTSPSTIALNGASTITVTPSSNFSSGARFTLGTGSSSVSTFGNGQGLGIFNVAPNVTTTYPIIVDDVRGGLGSAKCSVQVTVTQPTPSPTPTPTPVTTTPPSCSFSVPTIVPGGQTSFAWTVGAKGPTGFYALMSAGKLVSQNTNANTTVPFSQNLSPGSYTYYGYGNLLAINVLTLMSNPNAIPPLCTVQFTVPAATPSALFQVHASIGGMGTIVSTTASTGGYLNSSEQRYDLYSIPSGSPSITVTATPASGWTFSGWSGCPSISANACTIPFVITGAPSQSFVISVNASFTQLATPSPTPAPTPTPTPSPTSAPIVNPSPQPSPH